MSTASVMEERTGRDGGTRPSSPILEVEHLSKSFGATKALQDASLTVAAGQIHALVGENGSGKSTLVKLLSGVHRPDAGAIRIAEQSFDHIRSPSRALALGVATVYQEVLTVGPRSVLQNVGAGADGLFRRAGSTPERARRARALLEELLGYELDLDRPAESLRLNERQTVSIARALLRDPALLVLDEATSALDVSTRDRLFVLLRQRVSRGASVIFISHRMDEIAEIADRVTVMRSGETVATLDRSGVNSPELVRLMTGGERLRPAEVRERPEHGPVVLSVRDLRLAEGRAPINLEVRAGELIGIAGLEGHGQEEFLRQLWSGGPGAGQVQVKGQVITSPAEAVRHGMAYLPRERRTESLFTSKSIRENFALPTLGKDSRRGFISTSASAERFEGYARKLGVHFGHHDDLIATLSGGNQQKVVLARWLAADPCVLLLSDPTRGIDHGAKLDLYRLLLDLSGGGLAIVMLSTEVDEHIELVDRVLVFREHQVASEMERSELTRERLVGSFFDRTGST